MAFTPYKYQESSPVTGSTGDNNVSPNPVMGALNTIGKTGAGVAKFLFPATTREFSNQMDITRGAQSNLQNTGNYGQYLKEMVPVLNPFSPGKFKSAAEGMAYTIPFGAPAAKTLVGVGGKLALKGMARGAIHSLSAEKPTVARTLFETVAGGVLEPTFTAIGALPKLLKGGIKQNIYGETTAAAEKVVKPVKYDPILEKINNIPNTIGKGKQRAAKEFILKITNEFSPPQLPHKLEMTASEILKERSAQTNLLKSLSGVEREVHDKVRRILSDELHSIVPETIRPDQAYAVAAKLGSFLSKNWNWIVVSGLLLTPARRAVSKLLDALGF